MVRQAHHERTDIDHKGTDEVTDLERRTGGTLVRARGGRGSWGESFSEGCVANPGPSSEGCRKEGTAALAHGNRGRVPTNATPAITRQQVVVMAQERYRGFNHTHLAELLAETEGIVLSRSTVRRLLVRAGLPSPRYRRPPRHRYRRQRMPQEGMLLQLDGSHPS